MSRYSQTWDPYKSAVSMPPAPKRDRGAEGTADLLRLLGAAAPVVGTVGGGIIGGLAGGLPGATLGSGIGAAAGQGLGAMAGYGADMSTRNQDEAEIERNARRQLLMSVLGGLR